jgi:hypothetical protein
MKYLREKTIIIKLFIFLNIIVNSIQILANNRQSEIVFNSYPESDKQLEQIRIDIYKIAEEVSKKSDIYKKSIEIGELPDSFPEPMRRKAKKVRLDRDRWNPVMLYPTAVWRSCLYPNFKINYVSWCKQKLALSKTKIKFSGIK